MALTHRHAGANEIRPCFKGFEHVNRYWDRSRGAVVAKILPGEFYVSHHQEIIATTLGSCISACIWDPEAGVGGMNHFMLPSTDKKQEDVTWGNVSGDSTRYGNFAMEHLINEIIKYGGTRNRLLAKVFGGGKIIQNMSNVGASNAEFVLEYLQIEKIPILAQDLCEDYPRKVLFWPDTGECMMKRILTLNNTTLQDRERDYKRSIEHKNIDGGVELF